MVEYSEHVALREPACRDVAKPVVGWHIGQPACQISARLVGRLTEVPNTGVVGQPSYLAGGSVHLRSACLSRDSTRLQFATTTSERSLSG